MDLSVPHSTQRCHLFQAHPLRETIMASLEVLETYLDTGTERRELVRCMECGQLFYRDWLDVEPYFDNHGMQEYGLVPVENEASAEVLSRVPRMDRAIVPTLVLTWPPEDDRPFWSHR